MLLIALIDVGPVTVTSVPDEVIEAVNSLKTNRGGDCPELGMTGLYKALLQSLHDSVIYYFSDADAKDVNLAPVVLILAKQKRVKLNFILTGQCSFNRKRRSTGDSPQLGSQALYTSLAAVTGGQVLKIQKSKVRVFVDIIGSKISDRDSNDLIEVRIVLFSLAFYFSVMYSRLPITRTFEGNRKKSRVIRSSKQITRSKKISARFELLGVDCTTLRCLVI